MIKPPPEVAKAMRQLGAPMRSYLSHNDDEIYTSEGTIVDWHTRPRMVQPDVGRSAGTNAAGHYLPPSSPRGR